MASFPPLRSGVVGMYPATLGLAYRTEIVQFVNDTEQRWATRPALGDFELTFTDLNGYDLSILRDFFRSTKGAFDATWTMDIGAYHWPNCYFTQDDFTAIEDKPERYTVMLKGRQVRS